MASNKSNTLSPRKLPPGWERRVDFFTNKAYYVNHNTRTTQWAPPPPDQPIPPTPPNNLHNPNPIPLNQNDDDHNNNNAFSFPNSFRQKSRKSRHKKSSTFGSTQFSGFNINNLNINNNINQSPFQLRNLSKSKSKSPNRSKRPLPKPSHPKYNTTDTLFDIKYRHQSSIPYKPPAPPINTKNEPSLRNQRGITPPTYSKYKYTNHKYNHQSNAKSPSISGSGSIPPPPPRSPPIVALNSPPSVLGNNSHQIISCIPPPPPKKSKNKQLPSIHVLSGIASANVLHLDKSLTPVSANYGSGYGNKKHHMFNSTGNISPFVNNNGNTSPSGSGGDSPINPLPISTFYRNHTIAPKLKSGGNSRGDKSLSDAPSPILKPITFNDKSVDDYDVLKPKTRGHSHTTTSPFSSIKFNKLATKKKFNKFQEKLQKKYVKQKKKLKEKHKQRKNKKAIKDDNKSKPKRNKWKLSIDDNDNELSQSHSTSMTSFNSKGDDDNKDIEYSQSLNSVSATVPSLSTSHTKSYTYNINNKINLHKASMDKYDPDEIKLHTLQDIVELVTEPSVRGTQNQTILLYTYSIYTTRSELLSVILSRLIDGNISNRAQIKVLGLLRQWLKTENDFIDIEFKPPTRPPVSNINKPTTITQTVINDDDLMPPDINLQYQTKLKSLSPKPSTPQPELVTYSNESQATIDDDKIAVAIEFDLKDDNKQSGVSSGPSTPLSNQSNVNNDQPGPGPDAAADDNNVFPVFHPSLKRHRIKYSDDLLYLPPYVKLSPFAAYFRTELINYTKDNGMLIKLSKPILKQLSSDKPNVLLRDRTVSLADAPQSKIPKYKNARDIDSLSKLNPKEVARQICLLEYDIFKQIKFEEFLKQKSTKQKKADKEAQMLKVKVNSAHNLTNDVLNDNIEKMKIENDLKKKKSIQPNIDKMVEWFNKLVSWVQIEILYQHDLSKRTKIMSNLLKICDALNKYNNVSSLLAIRTGLCSAPIHRLKKTWTNLPKKARDTKAKLDELFKLGNGQKNLRDRVSVMKQPAIPHLALFLADVVFIHDGNDTFRSNKINWSKMKLLADRMQWISMFQQSPFIFYNVDIIVEYLKSRMKLVPEDFCYKLSREVEPPDNK